MPTFASQSGKRPPQAKEVAPQTQADCLQRTLKFAKIAQLVEHDLAKVGVAGSSPVFRSINRNHGATALTSPLLGQRPAAKDFICPDGGIGRRATLRG